MFEPAEIPYLDGKGEERIFKTTEKMLPFQEPILGGITYPKLSLVEPPRVMLDIGANHGAASVFFAEAYPELSIHAFEPGKQNFELLVQNTNHLDNLDVYNTGVLNVESVQPLYAGLYNEGEASINHPGPESAVSEEASFAPLQNFKQINFDEVDIVKIDVEGAEVDVLQNVLFNCKPKVIYIEYSSTSARVAIENILVRDYKLGLCRVLGFELGEMVYLRA